VPQSTDKSRKCRMSTRTREAYGLYHFHAVTRRKPEPISTIESKRGPFKKCFKEQARRIPMSSTKSMVGHP